MVFLFCFDFCLIMHCVDVFVVVLFICFYFRLLPYKPFDYILWFPMWCLYGISVCANICVSVSLCISFDLFLARFLSFYLIYSFISVHLLVFPMKVCLFSLMLFYYIFLSF